MWCHTSSPTEPLEGGLSCVGLEVSAVDGEALVSRATGDLQHLQLDFADGRSELCKEEMIG